MTSQECRRAIEGLSQQIENYAKLLVRVGCSIRPGQEFVVSTPVECADFARRVVKAGYEAGAGHVTVIWADDVIARMEYENVDISWFERTPSWKRERSIVLLKREQHFFFLKAPILQY